MIAPVSDRIVVPADYNIRLSMRPPETVVVVAPPGVTPTPEGVRARPAVSAFLSHDKGLGWPDAAGTTLARRVLAAGGSVLLSFETLADGLACHARLIRERGA